MRTSVDIITIGTLTMDIFVPVPSLREVLDPKQTSFPRVALVPVGAKIDIPAPHIYAGGGAFNAAVTFSRNGLKTAVVGCVGEDVFGSSLLEEMQKEHIDPHVYRDKKESTGLSFVITDKGGERSIFTHRGCSGDFSKIKIDPVLLSARWAYINPGIIPLRTILSIVKKLHAHGVCVAINPSSHMISHGFGAAQSIFEMCDVVLMNRSEAAQLTKIPYAQMEKIFKKLDTYVRGIAVMTDGKNGAFVSDGKKIMEAGSLHVQKIVDMTGAGDAFGSAFVTALMQKEDGYQNGLCDSDVMAHALRMGSANAAAVIGYIGATNGIVPMRELQKKFSTQWKKFNANIRHRL